MRLRGIVGVVVLLAAAVGAPADAGEPARVDDYLAARLPHLAAGDAVQVLVHADRVATARGAAEASGLRVVGELPRVGVVIAAGVAADVHRVRRADGVTFVEGDRPIQWYLDSSHEATAGDEARKGSPGVPGVDGSGVSVAIVDSGIDGTHPFFRDDEGVSKVIANVRTACPIVGNLVYQAACFVDAAALNDTEVLSLGGHGTHVAGIIAGYDVDVTSSLGSRTLHLHGAAPGASLVGVSVSMALSMASGDQGMHWVLDNHRAPCPKCPPIRVVNNSWGPAGGSSFCADCAATKIQDQLVSEGVVVVWAAGNDGGDGSGKDELGQFQGTNGDGNDPTPGVLMVGSYDDEGTGTREGDMSSFSSRGTRGKPQTYPDLAAPGSSILSSCRPYLPLCAPSYGADGPGGADYGTFTYLSGTSMAAPHIAGIVAQLFQANPAATPAQVEWALVTTARKIGSGYERAPRWGTTTSFDKGHGLVDAAAAVRAITSRSLPSDATLNPPPPKVEPEPEDPEPEETDEPDPEESEEPEPEETEPPPDGRAAFAAALNDDRRL